MRRKNQFMFYFFRKMRRNCSNIRRENQFMFHFFRKCATIVPKCAAKINFCPTLFENAPQLFQNAPQKSIYVPLCSKIGRKKSISVPLCLNLSQFVRKCSTIVRKFTTKINLFSSLFENSPQKQFSAPRVQKSATKTI